VKLVLGLAALALAFVLAAFWQDELRASLRSARAQERAALGLAPHEDSAPRELAGGWSRLTIGRPSGREALWPVPGEAAQVDEPERLPPRQPQDSESPERPPDSSPGSPNTAAPEAPTPAPAPSTQAPPKQAEPTAKPVAPLPAPRTQAPFPAGERIVVQRGQTLHSIAKGRYGRADAVLIAALAEHNGLADPAQLAVGQELALRSLASLLAAPRR